MSSLPFSRRILLKILPPWFLLFFALSSGLAGAAQSKPGELLIGIEPEHNIFDQMERYRNLAEYLSDQLGVQVKLTIMSRYGEILQRFKTLGLDGAFLTPYTAALGSKNFQLEPLVNPVNLSNEYTSQGVLFVRKDSDIKTIDDMRGKSIVFVDPATMEGYLFSLAYFKKQGIGSLNSFFNEFYFSGSHESSILAVLDGRADIGAAKNTVLNKLITSDPLIEQELKIVAQSPPFPEITLCARNDKNQAVWTKLRNVLLNMDKSLHGREALKRFQALRFIQSNKADFVRIEEMVLEVQSIITDPEE